MHAKGPAHSTPTFTDTIRPPVTNTIWVDIHPYINITYWLNYWHNL